jgi:predicted RND superfamily exporter protein
MPFNFVNMLAVPILIGLSIDNGLHLTERFHHDKGGGRGMIADTGRAMVVTALTSIAGFGSLSLVGVSWKYLAGWMILSGGVILAGWLHAKGREEAQIRKIAMTVALIVSALSIGLWYCYGTGGGIQSLGVLMTIGLVLLVFASLVSMPSLVLWLFGKSRRAEEQKSRRTEGQ